MTSPQPPATGGGEDGAAGPAPTPGTPAVIGPAGPPDADVPGAPPAESSSADEELKPAGESEPGFIALAGQIAALTASALALKSRMGWLRTHTEANASKAHTLAEMMHAADVEPRFIALTEDAAAALREVARATGEMANAADATESAARGFRAAHESEYRGVYEAVRSSGVRQAKPGFYKTR